MALLGDELGRFECWMWPLALVRDLELWVKADILHRGRDLARAVAVQPDHTEIELVGPDFRIVQRLFVARERRAAWITLEVESTRDLELQMRFTPRFEPMWPAGFGGRIALRDDETGAVALSEELGRFAALLGSPEAEPCEFEADHAAPREPLCVRIPCSAARAANGPLLFFIAGAEHRPQALSEAARVGEHGAAQGRSRLETVLASAREEYRWIARNWPIEARELEAKWKGFLARTTHFECDDARHTEAFLWAKIAIEKAWVEVDGLGRGLVAGLAQSGASERPGFGWFFGGDALAASRAMCAYGDFEGARRALEFVASQQRADGKMLHELVLSAGLCNWFEDYPYAYYKAQITPGFIACLHHYFERTGDLELVRKLWPNALAAYRCCLANLEPDGLLSNRTLGIAAVEAGSLVGNIRSDIYLHGVWISALTGMEQMALALELREVAADASKELARARAASESFWSDKDGRYGFAQLVDGSSNTDSTSYQALSLSRAQLVPERSLASTAALNRPNLASDWGVRLFADDASVYDTSSYNTGSVFPYTNNFAILAQFSNGLSTSGHQLLASQVALHNFSGLGFMPEHVRSDRCETPPRGVPHQIFSSSCVLQSTLLGALGLHASATAGALVVALQFRAGSHRHALRRMCLARSSFDLEMVRDGSSSEQPRSELVVRVRRFRGDSLKLFVRPMLAPLTRNARTADLAVELRRVGAALQARTLGVQLEQDLALTLTYESGPELLLDDSPLVEGATSSRLRVCEVEFDDTQVTWTLWGLAGRSYRIGVRSDRRVRFEGAREAGPGETGTHELEITFPADPRAQFVSQTLRAVALD
jgi:glycogen debranching enzyme